MKLRPYQQKAHDAIVKFVRKYHVPCLIEAATGAGKSHIIAALAQTIREISGGKRVLCLAPSAELVIQNSEKYKLTGEPYSIFSASAGQKSLRHPVVFGTPVTVKNKIKKFGKEFGLIVIDEAHGITPTVKLIIEAIRAENPLVRVVGMTATPYRMMGGYIFRQWDDYVAVSEEHTKDPYFAMLVDRITARELIDLGYLTRPTIGSIDAESYHTLDMELNNRGQFNASDVDRAYIGQGRKTAKIIADIVAKSRDRKGVMIFAATVQHARECLESLPAELSAIVTGETPAKERAAIIAAFKAQKIKYIVNVAVLTTGFDAPHVDVIAMLRATESPGLLQQIIGRGLRLSEGKADCLILDYAENLERHCPDGDIFNPTIKPMGGSESLNFIHCKCPDCNVVNQFVTRVNRENFKVDEHGYFVDLDGMRIPTEFGDMPAHHGRRCNGLVRVAGGGLDRCRYRWTFKACKTCEGENDIAARHCVECKAELVDPNEKLRIQFAEMKKDPTQKQTDEVIGWSSRHSVSKAGHPVIKVNVVTKYRSFSFWVQKEPKHKDAYNLLHMYAALDGNEPETITYRKDGDWYKVFAFNGPADEAPQ
jgi:DNA repair protein RadD